MAVSYHPSLILGRWREGYALDEHTVRSIYLGDDEFGRAQFDTTRSALGDLLYRLKFRGEDAVVPDVAGALVEFLRSWNPPVDLLVPVPPSRARTRQPVLRLARELGARLPLFVAADAVRRVRTVPELKNLYDREERLRRLAGAHAVDVAAVRGKRVLLLDDLFRSGATMSAVAETLYNPGSAADVYALTVTRTRSHT